MTRALAPGRVNLMGDHTDYAGGRCLPAAVDLVTEVAVEQDGAGEVRLSSDRLAGEAVVPLDVRPEQAPLWQPAWARYVAAAVAVVNPPEGCHGTVTSAIPAGAGLASSAALEVALALALGLRSPPRELARTCQGIEHVATGVPCGLMDQIASTSGVEDHALLLDLSSDPEKIEPVPLPEGVELLIVHSGESRTLAASAYAERRTQWEAASEIVGPFDGLRVEELNAIEDPVLQRRARHVVTESARATQMAHALSTGDLAAVSEIMADSQQSLSSDCEVSTAALDALVSRVAAVPGVIGARLTGAGFGGCVIALARAGALAASDLPPSCRSVRAHGPARLTSP